MNRSVEPCLAFLLIAQDRADYSELAIHSRSTRDLVDGDADSVIRSAFACSRIQC